MVKNPPAEAGDTGSKPGSGRSPGGGSGNPLQYSCLEIPWTEGLQRVQCDWAHTHVIASKTNGLIAFIRFHDLWEMF